ncbi:hypothetical protein IW262DRAFT_1370182 [Armillaria fumosa]|nr:hypothetical protein IW262DRAFT_1370182 [Armillaria fumosa]
MISFPPPTLTYWARSHHRILQLLVSLFRKQAMGTLNHILCTILTQALTRPAEKIISRVGPCRCGNFSLDCYFTSSTSSSTGR